jgi:transcriptional regulator with XRE-family HTH domain
MDTAIGYGGWVSKHAGTGNSVSFGKIVGWASAAAMASIVAVGTGGELQSARLKERVSHRYAVSADVIEVEKAREPSEDLAHIREVLSPPVSELATTLGVTRQSIYNWLNGEQVAVENAAKLRDLAQAADVFTGNGVTINATLLKRKFANGKTLLQAVQSGESAREAALVFVQVLKRESEQRQRINARFVGRSKAAATADFDLPSPSNPA